MTKRFSNFAEFYPFYLSQHQNRTCRALHYIGSCLVILVTILTFYSGQWLLLCSLPVIGYSFAWIGHLVFEKNRPATFKYPFYSLMADWVMLFEAFFGKRSRNI
ncbi:DUF962 domain-containing protein [Shewanella abyssi]|uniref:DUF962 domain-containing protein n=1 Tax=Shewanella abyssi TaxID=311789 RepID=UPI00200E7BBF|nr:DUF962 domain-containing protein [Shewanella abyssi]MCL1048517.1 DUF962 domain-containing protein [Shewanella abyssi]